VRVALDQAAARLRYQVHGSAQGHRRHALAAADLLYLDAGDPVVGQLLGSGEVLLTVVARLSSTVLPGTRSSGWNHVHQQLANMPLFRSTRAAKSSNVAGVSALTVKSDMVAT
jgi:hypothetical protein